MVLRRSRVRRRGYMYLGEKGGYERKDLGSNKACGLEMHLAIL